MTLVITLRCDECGTSIESRPFSRLTKMGSYRLSGWGHGFYIDGGKVLCPEHVPDPMPLPQIETWGEYDRRVIEDEQEEEARLEEIVRRNPGLERVR